MLFAFINDNRINRIENFDTEDLAMSLAHLEQAVICIDGMDPQPQVGWLWDKGVLKKQFKPVSPRQIRLAMVLAGIDLNVIEQTFDLVPEPTRTFTKIAWEYAVEFSRDDLLVDAIGPLLGFSPQQIDDIWELAATL